MIIGYCVISAPRPNDGLNCKQYKRESLAKKKYILQIQQFCKINKFI